MQLNSGRTPQPQTTDHDAGPGYEPVTLIGGPAGGQVAHVHCEQAELEADGEKYHRAAAGRFVAAELLRGMWGRG